jgi:tetratricopeptide (TPR) repeat protein
MKVTLLTLACLTLVALSVLLVVISGRIHFLATISSSSGDSKSPISSGFLNTNPAVQYVGDAKCAECHDSIMQKFNKHPMHLTLSEATPMSMPDCFRPEVLKPFQHDGLFYSVELKGDRIVHRQSLQEPDGTLRTTFETEVDYTIGSGSLGYSFLYQLDGRIMQTPISWYSQRKEWRLSPGYEHGKADFQRPIGGECFSCHGNYAEARPNTLNHFKMPLASRGYGIGCERCHGPGELHVKQEQGSGLDLPQGSKTIVNPNDASLAGHLREAVCEQCHLEGEIRILRRGRDYFDYRPGLPLYPFFTVFVNSEESGENHAVGHVDQMHESQCYKGSQGSLSCTSCHDPHEIPEPNHRVAFFRDRCLQCHKTHGCSLSETARRANQNEDSCINCHMPKGDNKEVAHAAVTNHRVLRKAPPPSSGKTTHGPKEGLNPLVHFHAGLEKGAESDLERDLGIALATASTNPINKTRAASLLRKATQTHPDDLHAFVALAGLYGALEKHGKSLETYDKALALDQTNELALAGAGEQAAAYKKPDLALGYLQRAAAVNPFNASYHSSQARVYAIQEKWEKAAEEARLAMKLNFDDKSAHQILIMSLVHLNKRSEAEVQVGILERWTPSQAEAIRKWFNAMKNRAKG